LEHAENLGAIAQKGKKLETKQISEKYDVFQPIINTFTYMVQRNHIEAPCEIRIESQGNVEHGSCIQELKDTIAVGSCEEPVDSYADGTWQLSTLRNLTLEKARHSFVLGYEESG
jgi:hypothetical protein